MSVNCYRYLDLGVFEGRPKTLEWRASLADRPSVKGAVDAGYPARLAAFLVARRSYISGLFELMPVSRARHCRWGDAQLSRGAREAVGSDRDEDIDEMESVQ